MLCDMMMPEMSGMDVYERVQVELGAAAPRFVFMSGGIFTARAQVFVAAQRPPVLDKPFTLATLVKALARIIHDDSA